MRRKGRGMEEEEREEDGEWEEEEDENPLERCREGPMGMIGSAQYKQRICQVETLLA